MVREFSDEKQIQVPEINEQSGGNPTKAFPTEEKTRNPLEAKELSPALSLDPQILPENKDDEQEQESPRADIQTNSVSENDDNGNDGNDGHALGQTWYLTESDFHLKFMSSL